MAATAALPNPPHCPVCRQEMPANLNIKVCLHELTNNLAVECSNAVSSCKGSSVEAESHEREFPKWVVECANEGCGHSATREEMREHGGTCKKAQVHRSICRRRVMREGLHYTSRKAAGLPARLQSNFTSVCEKIFLYYYTKVKNYISQRPNQQELKLRGKKHFFLQMENWAVQGGDPYTQAWWDLQATNWHRNHVHRWQIGSQTILSS